MTDGRPMQTFVASAFERRWRSWPMPGFAPFARVGRARGTRSGLNVTTAWL